MKKILILLVLCLGVLSFSASKTSREVAKKVDTVPGFEKLIWGMSKDEVINKLGEPKFNFDKILTYENLEFIGLNVEVDFYFKDGELYQWRGDAETTSSDNFELLRMYMRKYPKGTNWGTGEMYHFMNSERENDMSIYFYMDKKPAKVEFRYTSPKEFDRKEQERKEEKLKKEQQEKQTYDKI